jgi:enoyl-CoA hydratase
MENEQPIPAFSTIQYEIQGAVVRLWMNRPELANAQDLRMLEELDAAFTLAEGDPDVRVVILAGRGKHFSSGHDLKSLDENERDSVEKRWAQESRYYYDVCARILALSKPTIAQVQGGAVAAGFMLANVCDLIVAAENAFFADPVLNSFGSPGVEILIHPWVMGTRRAKEMLFTGGRVTAQEACQAGMVNRVVALDALDAETLALAGTIAKAPPFAMKLMKRAFQRALDAQGLTQSLQAAFDLHQLAHATSEQVELTRQFSVRQQIESVKTASKG